MTKVKDIMTTGPECIGENETLLEAARKMADLDVGVLPICGEDNKLHGMLTDRDIVVKALARGKDIGNMHARDLAEGKPVTVGADEDVDAALRAMIEHKVRRLPVIDKQKKLVGLLSQGDIAKSLESGKVGQLVEAISAAP